ncbi:hypothetical protein D9M70_429790 [compost metagenome]
MVGLLPAAAHQGRTLAGLAAVRRQRGGVDLQSGDALPQPAAGDEQSRLGQAVAGQVGLGPEAAGREARGEGFQAVLADRLGTGEGNAPAGQVQPGQLALGDALVAEAVGEVRAAADGAVVATDRLQPAYRPFEEVLRRHQHHRHAAVDGLQQPADQAHVVVQRQPTDDHVAVADPIALADQPLVGFQVGMADLHALRHRRGTGGVLQEGDGFARHLRRLPIIAEGRVQFVHRQQGGQRTAEGLPQPGQRSGQPAGGEDQPRLRVGDDRHQPLQVLRLGGFRRIGRHRDHPGVQAGEERRDVVRPAGEQQDRSRARLDTLRQCRRDASCPAIQLPVCQHLSPIVSEKAQRQLIRLGSGPIHQGNGHGNRAFEGIRHLCTFLDSSARGRFTGAHDGPVS